MTSRVVLIRFSGSSPFVSTTLNLFPYLGLVMHSLTSLPSFLTSRDE